MEIDDYSLGLILKELDFKSLIQLAMTSKKMYQKIESIMFEKSHIQQTYLCDSVSSIVQKFNLYQLLYMYRKTKDSYIKLCIDEKRQNSLRTLLTREQNIIHNISFQKRRWYIVQAYAGTGKTTTLYHICKKNSNKSILYLAFNKSLEQQAREGKLGQLDHVDCFTFHSFVRQQLGQNGYKIRDVIPEYNIIELQKIFPRLSLDYLRNIQFEFKKFCFSSDKEPVNKYVKRLWNKMIQNQIPYTHDGYLKYFELLKVKVHYDIILLDEAQDSTECMLSIIKRQNSSRVLIGDSYQQIYKFRGSVDPFQMIQEQLSPSKYESYWLSHTFRYGIDLAHMTNLFLSDFMDISPNISSYAPQNTYVYKFTGQSVFRSDRFLWDSALQKMLLCCTNKTLYDYVFQYISLHKHVRIIGNDKNYDEELSIVQDFMNIELQNYSEIQNEILNNFLTLEDVADHFYSLDETTWINRLVLYDEYGTELISYYRLCNIYVDQEEPEYIVSTIHKCKGLEFDHVKLAEDFPILTMNSEIMKRKTQSWKERYNTIYVAITRARKSLTLNTSLTHWIEYHLDKKKYYSIGNKNTCRKCGSLTTRYENLVCICENCCLYKITI